MGAGPAGLAAAHGLAERGLPAIVLERDGGVGGIARTVEHRGYRFDLGGHRFFTKVAEIDRLWRETLGDDFLLRSRLSRIHYRGHFFHYPLRPLDALTGLGAVESARVLGSYARARLFPGPEETTFEQWVVHRFGRRLYEIFFQTYTEKVWGIPCSEISADWAAQRIKNLDLLTAVRNALLGGQVGDGEIVTSLIDRFHYPRLGPGMMWERWRDRLAGQGVETVLDAEVVRLHHRNGRVFAADVRRGDREERVEGAHFVSTMPLRDLIAALEPTPPADVAEAVGRLRYRDFLIVVLIVRGAELFPDNWIYVHSPEVSVGRIQNFKNWSAAMVPDPSTTSLGLEYFVSRHGEMWGADDAELVALGAREAAALGLLDPADVLDGVVVRVPDAYPVYDRQTNAAVASLRAWLGGLENLYPVGRNGQHRYNNQDHSMLTGLHAARTIAGTPRPIWDVNVESSYHEEAAPARPGDRAVPGDVRPGSLEEVLQRAFARYDPAALGTATGAVAGGGLFLLTAIALLGGETAAAPPLSLLGHYLFGYALDWRGLIVGSLEAAVLGFAFGALAAALINRLVGWTETVLIRELEAEGTLDPLSQGDA
ncbi:MAG TPA: NAD(P)/FAD-dependent oxidoreductase [Gemmatimonadota bacterium]|nr:NAD(P)/FAD-dependent oxidoreductase [Gemmatimonadota bacterium]